MKPKKKRNKRKKNKQSAGTTLEPSPNQELSIQPQQCGTEPHLQEAQPQTQPQPQPHTQQLESEPQTQEPTTPPKSQQPKLTLLEKIAAFKDFPRFWADENDLSDDMDPQLKAQQDKEIEEFQKRLEQINSTSMAQRKPIMLGSKFQEIAALCRNKAKQRETSAAVELNAGKTDAVQVNNVSKKGKKKGGKKT